MDAWDRWHELEKETPDYGDRVAVQYVGNEGRAPQHELGMRFEKEEVWETDTVTRKYWPMYSIEQWRHLDEETAARWLESRRRLQNLRTPPVAPTPS